MVLLKINRDILPKKENIFFLIIFSLSLIFLLYMMRYRISLYDDGVLLYGAERVLAGDIPYKDFWYIYAPGNLYVLALIFKIFGPSVLIERIFITIISFFILISTYLIGKKIITNMYSLYLIIFLTTIIIFLDGPYAHQNLPILFSLISIIFFINYLQKEKNLDLISTGIIIGVCAIFKQDISLYTFLAVSITLIIFKYLKTDKDLKERIKLILKPWIIVMGTTLLILIPVILYFLLVVPIPVLETQFIDFTLNIYPQFQIPLRPPTSLFYLITIYFSPFVLTIIFIWLISQIKKGQNLNEHWPIIFLFILGLISFNSFRLQMYFPHLYLTTIISIILFNFLIIQYINIPMIIARFKGINKDKIGLNILFTILTILIVLTFTLGTIKYTEKFLNQNTVELDQYKGSGIYALPNFHSNGFIDTTKYVRENLPANEKIFVASYCEDKIVENQVLFYFLADRPSGTKYHEMLILIATTPEVQNEIISELQLNNVKYIILLEDKRQVRFGSTKLIEYIKNNYKAIKSIGDYAIYDKN